jgi:replicative DNA helicase
MVLFVHRPEYYHIYQDDNGRDLHGMAQIIIAKHRKGATGDVLLTFRGEFTRFENPEEKSLGNRAPMGGGEIVGSKINGDGNPPMPDDYNPFENGAPIPPPSGDGPLPF